MSGPVAAPLAAAVWPILWAGGFAAAGATLLVDLLASPWVLLARRRPRRGDAPPATRNASIVVLNWNGRRHLESLLPSLEKAVDAAPGDHEVIVVDNGSDDGSVAFVRERLPRARIVALPENRFFVRGIRAGVAAASRDVLVLLNNDTVVERDFLARLLARFGEPDLFGVTARIALLDPSLPPVETGKTRAFWRRGDFDWLQSGILDEEPPAVPALWAGGGSSAFDARKFAELGGFDDLFHPFYVEDVALSYAAWRRGWRVVFEPRALVRHAHRGTSARAFGRAFVERIERRNRHLFLWAHVHDPARLLSHAFHLPWNCLKRARRTGLGPEVRAFFEAWLRLPRAWLRRARGRAAASRSDRAALALANCVSLHARAVGPAPASAAGRRVLVFTTEGDPPPSLRGDRVEVVRVAPRPGGGDGRLQDLHGLVPARFRAILADPAARDAVRDALADRLFDAVHAIGPAAGALVAPHLRHLPGLRSVLEIREAAVEGGLLERARERGFLSSVARRFDEIRLVEERAAAAPPAARDDLPAGAPPLPLQRALSLYGRTLGRAIGAAAILVRAAASASPDDGVAGARAPRAADRG